MPFTEKQFNGIMKLLEKAGFFFQALYMLLYLCFHAWNNVPYTLPDLVITHTSQDSFYKWTKISSVEINIFQLKNDGKKWSRIYFQIDRAPSEIPANLPGQFSPNGQIFWHWAAAAPKGLGEF